MGGFKERTNIEGSRIIRVIAIGRTGDGYPISARIPSTRSSSVSRPVEPWSLDRIGATVVDATASCGSRYVLPGRQGRSALLA